MIKIKIQLVKLYNFGDLNIKVGGYIIEGSYYGDKIIYDTPIRKSTGEIAYFYPSEPWLQFISPGTKTIEEYIKDKTIKMLPTGFYIDENTLVRNNWFFTILGKNHIFIHDMLTGGFDYYSKTNKFPIIPKL